MQRLKNFGIGSLIVALLVLPSTSSSRNQESPPESSPFRTSRAVEPQGPETPLAKFVKAKKPIPNRYIVVLEDDVVPDNAAPEVKRARIAAIAKSHAQTYRGTVDFIYE